MSDLYQEIILDHYRSPLHAGLRAPFSTEAHGVNPTCGDEITLRIQLEGDTLKDISYETSGCSISCASASVMADLVMGSSPQAALALQETFLQMLRSRTPSIDQLTHWEESLGDGVAFQGVSSYPARIKCALLAWMSLKDALLTLESLQDSPQYTLP